MKAVQPIRDRELLLVVGFNTSLRISDIRRFKVKDLRGQDYAEIKAQKTGKEARILINPSARRIINRLLAGRPADEYILQSRKKDANHMAQPITRQRAYQIINQIARKASIRDHIGCHTLRKTFGYHYYQKTQDVVSLQRILCHSSRRETLIYIGVIQEEIDESLMNFNLTRRR